MKQYGTYFQSARAIQNHPEPAAITSRVNTNAIEQLAEKTRESATNLINQLKALNKPTNTKPQSPLTTHHRPKR